MVQSHINSNNVFGVTKLCCLEKFVSSLAEAVVLAKP